MDILEKNKRKERINSYQYQCFKGKQPQITVGYVPTLRAESHGNLPKVIVGAAIRGRYNSSGKIEQSLEVRDDEVSNALTTVHKDSLVIEKRE